MKKLYTLFIIAVFGWTSYTQAQVTDYNVCTGDSVCLVSNVIGGTMQWQASPDLTNWTNIPFATTFTFCAVPFVSNLYYRAEVTTACGPVYSDTVRIILLSLPTADGGSPVSGTCLDTVTLGGAPTASGGAAPYTYSWSPPLNLSSTTVANPDLNGIYATTVYTITVTDANGCVASDTVSATVLPFSVTYNFTGGIQTFTPNPCFNGDTIFIQCWGSQGGNGDVGGNSSAGGPGGLGGYAEGLTISVGQVFNVFVGGQGTTPTGGFNGGGNGGTQNAGGGGGASDVRVGGTAEANRIITAGGGGGGGRGGCESTTTIVGGTGGVGGGGNGGNGTDAPTSGGVAGGGGGGIGPAGGAAGIGCAGFLGSAGNPGVGGTGGTGGAGQACCCFGSGSIPGGGGGGGGFLGGGGGGGGSAGTTGCSGNDKGAGGGGSGGSSDTSGVLNGATNSGIWLGNGMVTFTIMP